MATATALRPSETSWAILAELKGVTPETLFEQERIMGKMSPDLANLVRNEGFDPRHVACREQLIGRVSMSPDKATAYVRRCSPELASILEEALSKAQDPVGAFKEFQKLTRIAP